MALKYRVHDLMAEFAADNPYPDDFGNKLMVVARKYRNLHPEEFIFIKDWRENIHSKYIFEFTSPLKQTFGVEVNPDLQISQIPQLSNIVKGFFQKYGSDPRIGITDQLRNWAGQPQVPNNPMQNAINNTFNPNQNQSFPFQQPSVPQVSPILVQQPNSILNEAYVPNVDALRASQNEIASYDFGNKCALPYSEVMKICLNKARQDLVMVRGRDLELEKAAEQRRNELEIEINKYFQVREIHLLEKRDLTKLSIGELEELLHLCEMKFDSLKVNELILSWVETFSTIVNDVCPDGGIPMPRGRRLKLKTVKNQLKETVFNPSSVVGLAFSRSIDKRNIHVSDEGVVFNKVVQIFLTNIEMKKGETKPQPVENHNDTYEESSELLEIEE